MSAEQQRPYKNRSTDEFQEQRSALLVRGIKLRSSRPIMKPGRNVERELPADSETSERVGPYVIDVANPSLGGGAYGRVLRCQHPQTGCGVAVKVYRGLDGEADCHHEVAQMKLLLKHVTQQVWFPRLVNSAVTGKPWPWMAAELCGPSLASVLRKPDMQGKPKTWSVAAQLRSALQALHDGGILHLDVKPANVLWCPFTDQLKVCDFGMSEIVARLANPAESPRFLLYVSAAYRPPELWPILLKEDSNNNSGISKKLLTTAVDVWSYTRVVYEVETGQHFMPKGDSGLRTWCEHWPELWSRQRNLPKCAPKYQSSCTKLLRAGNWASFVLSGCAPEPDKREWPKLCPK